MEERILIRQDDVVRALTRKLSDRNETDKKFRVANFHLKKI